MNDDQFTTIVEKLDTLINIQALSSVSHLNTKSEKIIFLSEAGLSPKEITSIVGGKPGTVRQIIYAAKKKAEGL